jgi:serine/threonine protein kinase
MLERALELAPDEQASYLDEECAGDPSLRREVDSLLQHASADDFLENVVGRAAAAALDLTETVDLEGRRLGPWNIDEKIGEGGMGAVYRAQRADGEFKKQVAIKVVRQRVANQSALRRFRAERQILADVEHPNIARLIDAGTTDAGLPYLVMEYVDGEPVDAYCDHQRLSIEQRLRLFRKICSAVQFAHEHHVVHRDLKPSNVLITKEGTPKLLDFGIAKLLAPGMLNHTVEITAEFQRLMTPAFASPEQIRGDTVTPASDVYSLGVILYALVCGHSPYDAGTETSASTEDLVCDLEPLAPSQALRQFAHTLGSENESIAVTPESVAEARGTDFETLFALLLESELDEVVLKALAKRPAARYRSAAALGDALQAYRRDDSRSEGATPAPAPSAGFASTKPPAPAASRPPPATLFEWGHLVALRKIGEGVFGQVYECRDTSLGMRVALKLFRSPGDSDTTLSAEVGNRILREGRLLARVRHPNVLQVHGVGVHDETVGMWMEFIDGKNLEQLLETQGRFGAREACLVGIDLCSALAAVHGQGVVHRDIKAQNVIREDGGRIVLMDFGSGRDLVRDTRFAAEGTVGTPLYMAPELLRGGVATPRSDIYALGVLLFRLLTGSFPVEADSWPELIERHARGDTQSLRDLRADLQPAAPRFVRVLEQALHVDPERRFASAGQFQQALEASIDATIDQAGRPSPSPSTAAGDQTTTPARSHLLTWGGGGVLALMSFTFLGLTTWLVERQAMGVPQAFATEGIPEFLILGIRASIPALIIWILPTFILIMALFGAAKLALRLIGDTTSRQNRWRRAHDTIRRWQGLFMAADPAPVAAGFFVVGLLANLGVGLWNSDMWEAIGLLSDDQTIHAADLTPLGDLSAQYAYEWSFAALFVGLSIASVCMVAAARRQHETRPVVQLLHVCVFGTIALSAVLLTMPWKLLVSDYDYTIFAADKAGAEFWSRPENTHVRWPRVNGETVDLDGRMAFIIARNREHRWLYFPELRYRTSVEARFAEPLGNARIFITDD